MLLFCLTSWLFKGEFPSEIFVTVTTQYVTTLSVCMIKDGYENGKKYNNESEGVDI
jgi:hypothetical protein